MRTHREGLLNKLPTLATGLCGIAGVHSYDLMTSSCSLLFKDFEECSPTGIHDGFRQVMIFQHVRDLKVFDHDTVIPFSIGLSTFEMVITPLTIDFQVRLGDVLSSLTLALTPFLTTRKRALFTSQGLL